MIKFNKSIVLKESIECVNDCLASGHVQADGKYTYLCQELMEKKFSSKKILLTSSCTDALEMAYLMAGIKENDEVIMPSFTYTTTASACVLFGGKCVFVDVKPEDMNIDETKIEEAITPKTKAITVVHYGGIACNMDVIMDIAKRYNLIVIEDAAQGINCTYKGKYLGTIGDFGCYSFHETKNYSMGEGGAISINNDKYLDLSDIVRDSGTNRVQFKNGHVNKYSWTELGSSYCPSDMLAAFLYPQLVKMDEILTDRLTSFNLYEENLKDLKGIEIIKYDKTVSKHNGHLFFIKVKDEDTRLSLQTFLKNNNVQTTFHYVPLHTSDAGLKYCIFHGQDIFTTKDSLRLLRLPMYYGLTQDEVLYVCKLVKEFFK